MSAVKNFLSTTGFAKLFSNSDFWQYLVMYVIVGVLFYLAVVKKFEPLLLLPIAFGMLLANLPGAELIHTDFFFNDYYLSVAKDATYGPQFQEFIASLGESAKGVLYTIGENGELTFTFTEAALAETDFTLDSIKILFDEAFGNPGSSYTVEYYLSLLGNEELIPQFKEFVASLGESAKGILYTVNSDGVVTSLNFSNVALEQSHYSIESIKGLFDASFASQGYNIGYIDDSGVIQIKMSTMLKEVINYGGLLDFLYLGVKLGIYPSLIFLGVGAMTDFSPLISNPKSLFMGAGAQLGVFAAFFGAIFFFTPMEAASIGIIGGADGPTAILVTKTLAPHLLGAIAIAAYSYMALIPIIQPPFMRLLTTKKERAIKMQNLRSVSKLEKVIFPIIVTLIVTLIIPDAAPLVGFLMLGNLFNVSGVSDRLSKTAQNELINIVTICLGVSVGATANAQNFLKVETLLIIGLGLTAFMISTCGGLIVGKIMCKLSGGKINPLIGSAGVSAVPMAARVAQDEGRKADPSNFLLMHAMGPNVAGVIGSAVAAGVFLSYFA